MGKLALVAMGFAVAFTFGTPASADAGDLPFAQLMGTNMAPIPQQQSSSCDPNYSGACVPIASDVDCAGGSGNGPAYVEGPVTVVGNDIYELDRDGNGTGCE